MKLLLVAFLFPMFLLTGCEQPSSPPVAGDGLPEVASAGQEPAVVEAQSSAQLRTEPASLSDCNAKVINVIWDLSKTHPGENAVEIWVGEHDSAKVFAAGGNSGQAMTGPWATPGTTFSLRLPNKTETLAQAIVGGPNCPATN